MPQKDIGPHLIEDTKVLCKNGKVIVPTSLRHRGWIIFLDEPTYLDKILVAKKKLARYST